jgi:hypothetical protein
VDFTRLQLDPLQQPKVQMIADEQAALKPKADTAVPVHGLSAFAVLLLARRSEHSRTGFAVGTPDLP